MGRKQRREVEFYKLQHESSTASHLWMARLRKLGSKKPRGASISTTCVVLSHVSRADAPAGRETLPSVDELGELEGTQSKNSSSHLLEHMAPLVVLPLQMVQLRMP